MTYLYIYHIFSRNSISFSVSNTQRSLSLLWEGQKPSPNCSKNIIANLVSTDVSARLRMNPSSKVWLMMFEKEIAWKLNPFNNNLKLGNEILAFYRNNLAWNWVVRRLLKNSSSFKPILLTIVQNLLCAICLIQFIFASHSLFQALILYVQKESYSFKFKKFSENFTAKTSISSNFILYFA